MLLLCYGLHEHLLAYCLCKSVVCVKDFCEAGAAIHDWNMSVFAGLTPQWYQICWSPQSWTRPCRPGLFVPQSRWWSGLELKSRLLIWSDPWSLLSPRMFLQPAGTTVNVAFNLSRCKIPSICASEPVRTLRHLTTDTLLSVWVCHMSLHIWPPAWRLPSQHLCC